MNKKAKKPLLQRIWPVFVAVFAVVLMWAFYDSTLSDIWGGLGYIPSLEAETMRDNLELTPRGKRIFNATRVALEDSDDFNEHCSSYDAEVTLLGCYVDGRVYVYNITDAKLKTANQVTTAHELLHAIWERLSDTEQEALKPLLMQVYRANRNWFDDELEPYGAEDRTEEIYVRAGTKLAELPEELEAHYARYFRNRAQIVHYYEEYAAPFLELKFELEQLYDQITTMQAEIESARSEYLRALMVLNQKIELFNRCADMAGCFTNQTAFNTERSAILAEQSELEQTRDELNDKIEENNRRVERYRTLQQSLGELNAAMNSNIEPTETLE